MATPHDHLFKLVFARPEEAAAELRSVLPEAIARRLDWHTLRVEPGSFVEPALREQHADLLYSVQLAGRPALVYVLLEHKAQAQSRTIFQLLVYMVRIWQRWLRGRPLSARLPPILPVILYHGKRRWRAAREMIELFDLDGDLRRDLAPLLPSFRVVIDDLAEQSEEALWQRALPALARLTLLCLQRARTSHDLRGDLERWASLMRDVLTAPSGAEAIASILTFIMEVREGTELDEIRGFVRSELGSEAEERVMTSWTKIKDECREVGRVEGRVEGSVETLLRLLTRRFGTLPDPVVTRIRRGTIEELDAWTDRVLDAATLDDVLRS